MTAAGEWSMNSIPIATPPLFYSAVAGTTTSFQLWHRDIGGSNFSNGLSIDWQ
ncbi:MAG: ABC-type spermidine/putrescine transport system permease subunit II [Planctomycetota bacterium]